MTTTELDTLTDHFAKTNSTMFPVAEKLLYYNIAYGLLNSLIIDEQEDTFEEEYTKDTVAGQSDYQENARLHHINWLKINYEDGFINAVHKSEGDLISVYGTGLATELTGWSASSPIYHYKGKHIFIYPAPTAAQAGAARLKFSAELLPADLAASDSPDLLASFHYLLAVYAAFQYHDNNGEDSQAVKRKAQFDEGTSLMIATAYPRSRQAENQIVIPNDSLIDY